MKIHKNFVFIFFLIIFLFQGPSFLFLISSWHKIEFASSRFLDVLTGSLLQALLSACGTLFFGALGALGLFFLEKYISVKALGAVQFLILLPSLLPKVFIVVSALNLFSHFPLNTSGVVVLHILSELGLAAILIYHLLREHLRPYFEICYLYGAHRLTLLRVCFPLVQKNFISLFVIFFLYFIMSLSIPLLLVGSQYSSLELSIYLELLQNKNTFQAAPYFLLQGVVIFMALMSIRGGVESPSFVGSKVEKSLSTPTSFCGVLTIFFPCLILLLNLFFKLPSGVAAVLREPAVLNHFPLYVLCSFWIGLTVGMLTFLFLSLLCYFYSLPALRKYFIWIMVPSVSVLAFSFVQTQPLPTWSNLLLLCGLLILCFVSSLLRFGILQSVRALDSQVETAHLLGASHGVTWWRVVQPQLMASLLRVSGLASVWAMGDFAMSRYALGKDLHLAMWIQSLMYQYRWDIALTVTWFLIFVSGVVFLIFWSLANVIDQKFK